MSPLSFTADEVSALIGSRFTLGKELGRGAQGVVFRANRTSRLDGTAVNDEVAVKVHLDPQQDVRVQREIAVMERLRHPCLANLLEHDKQQMKGEQVRTIIWEHIDGLPLSKRIAQGPVSPKIVAAVGRDVASALGAIWGEKVVHRDIAPKNIMLKTGDEHAVLIDLGVARHLDQTTLTGAGWTFGTPGYMSPEQHRGEQQLTCLSDVFSLGVTLTEALLRRHPAGHQQALVSMGTVAPSAMLPTAPGGLTAILDKMMALRAARRPSPQALVETFTDLYAQL